MKLALPGVDLGYILQLDVEEADDNKTNISDPLFGQCSTGRCGDSETDWCIASHFRPTAWSVQYRPVWWQWNWLVYCLTFQTHSLVSAVQAGVVTVKLTGVLPDISDPQLGQCSTGRCGDSETDWCIAWHFRPTVWSVQYRPVWWQWNWLVYCLTFQTHSLVSAVQAGVVTVKLTGVLPDISDPQLGQCSTGRCGDSETDWCIAWHFRPTAWSVQYRPVWWQWNWLVYCLTFQTHSLVSAVQAGVVTVKLTGVLPDISDPQLDVFYHSEPYYTRINILGSCLFLQSVPATRKVLGGLPGVSDLQLDVVRVWTLELVLQLAAAHRALNGLDADIPPPVAAHTQVNVTLTSK